MIKSVFTKENVTPFITFGGISIGILLVCILDPEATGIIALLVSVPTFLLSISKLVIEVIEMINDLITKKLGVDEQNPEKMINVFREMNKPEIIKNGIDDFSAFFEKFDVVDKMDKDYQFYLGRIEEDFEIIKLRVNIRKVRRGMLWFYYAIIMSMIVLLILHGEIATIINNMNSLSGLSNILALISIIVILIEAMMKEVIKNIVKAWLYKEYKVDVYF